MQPVTLDYVHINALPLTRAKRPAIAWIGNMDLGPHVWQALGLGRIGVRLVFHPPLRRSDHPDRKALARACGQIVRQGLTDSRRGRYDQRG